MKPQIPDAGVNNGKAGLSRSSGIFAGSGLFSLSGGAIDLLAEMGKSVLSVVPGLSPVYNRLGNPAEYGDNISRIGNLGTDANDPVQDVEAEQPVFRDVGNAADYGDGYLYLDGVVGSYASVPGPIGALTNFTLQVDGLSPETVRPAATGTLMGQYGGSSASASFILRIQSSGAIWFNLYDGTNETHYSLAVPTDTVGIRITRVGTLITYWVDTGSGYVSHGTDTSVGTALNNPTSALQVGIYGTYNPLTGTISRAQIWDNGAQTGDPVVDLDFRNATHKLSDTDTFIANSGQQITINGGATVYNPPVASTLRTTTDLGFLDLDGVVGSYASVPDAANLNGITDFVMEATDVYMDDWGVAETEIFFSKYISSNTGFIFRRQTTNINFYAVYDDTTVSSSFAHGLTGAATASIRVTRVGTSLTAELDTGSGYAPIGAALTVPADAIKTTTNPVEIGSRDVGTIQPLTGTISRAQIWSDSTQTTKVLDADFRNRTTTLTDTETFVATSGQTVTINGGATARRKITLNTAGFLHCDGVSGSYASVPHDASLNLTDQLEIVARVRYDSYTGADSQSIVTKWASGDFNFRFHPSGFLELFWKDSTPTSKNAQSSYTVFSNGISDGETIWVKMTLDATGASSYVNFYTSKDNVENEANVSWTALGTTRTVSSATGITSSTNEVGFGSFAGNDDLATGSIFNANYKAVIGGSPVLDADFRDNPTTLGDTDTLAAATGQTITINGGATAYAARVKAPKSEAGYLHLPGTTGNYASVPEAALEGLTDFVMEAKDVYMSDWAAASSEDFMSKWASASGLAFIFRRTTTSINFYTTITGSTATGYSFPHGLTGPKTISVKLTRVGTLLSAEIDTGAGYISLGAGQNTAAGAIIYSGDPLEIGSRYEGVLDLLNGKIGQARIWDNGTAAGTPVLDVDFDRAPANATSFAAKTGQTVTINQSTITGDRAKIVKSSEIFYDGGGDEFDFTLSSTFTGKMLVASTQGILVADVSRAGATQIDEKGVASITGFSAAHGLEQKGVMLLSDSSSPAALTSAFVARGAVKSFAARTNFTEAFRNMELTSFPTIDVSNGVDCPYAWDGYRGTTFPALNFASATSLSNAWVNSTSLTSVSAIQAPVCSDFGSAWQDNTALATIDPAANFGESATGVNFNNAFKTSGLTALPAGLDMSQGDTFQSAFQDCGSLATIGTGVKLGTASSSVNFISAFRTTALTALPAGLDMSQGSLFNATFRDCTSLATIGSGVLLGTANATATVNYADTFNGCTNLTALPAGLDLSQGSDFNNAFNGCASLTTIGTGVKLGTAANNVNFDYAFYNTALTALPAGLNLSKGESFSSAFQDCSSLATIGNGVLLGTASSGVDFTNAFSGCSNLVTLPANLNLSKGDDFQNAFYNCSSLVTFPAGAFDTMGTPLAYCFLNAWLGCSALSGASVDAILDSIDTSGQSPHAFVPNITIDYDTGTTAPSYTTLASLKAKGWVIIVNGTTL